MIVTVQDLIDRLQQIEDKTQQVCFMDRYSYHSDNFELEKWPHDDYLLLEGK